MSAGAGNPEYDKNEEGKNKRGRTIPFIMPYKPIALSTEAPYKISCAGIKIFSTVLKTEFNIEAPDKGKHMLSILGIMLSPLISLFLLKE